MIEDTSKRDPIEHYVGSLGAAGPSGYIEEMERAGQSQVVHSDQLPAKGPWEDLIALGFAKGEKVDDLFVRATLSQGWRREGSDHAMWSHIVDQRGIRRVGVFYKAAFYDRKASISIMNVGYDAATGVIYGDEAVEVPAHWTEMTDRERQHAVVYTEDYLEKAKEHPKIYADRSPRARQLLDLMSQAR